jgi:hypothetical protein
MELKEMKAKKGQLDLQGHLVMMENKVILVIKENLAHQETLVNLVKMVLMEKKENVDQRDLKDQLDQLVTKGLKETQELLVM